MPRYKMMFDSSPETAKALTAIMIDQVENFSFETVVEGEPAQPNGAHHTKHRVRGTTTHGEVLSLCKAATGNRITKARIAQTLSRMGYNPGSASAVMSRMVNTGKFAKDEKHFWLTEPSLTADGLSGLMKIEYEKSRK